MLDTMRSETKEDVMVQMYAKIDEILKKNLSLLLNNLKQLSESSEISTESDPFKETTKLIQRSSNSVRIVQRVVINQKQFFEEALIKSTVAIEIMRQLEFYITLL